jgi:hypothetical protein
LFFAKYWIIVFVTEVSSTIQRPRLKVYNVLKVEFASVSDKTAKMGERVSVPGDVNLSEANLKGN